MPVLKSSDPKPDHEGCTHGKASNYMQNPMETGRLEEVSRGYVTIFWQHDDTSPPMEDNREGKRRGCARSPDGQYATSGPLPFRVGPHGACTVVPGSHLPRGLVRIEHTNYCIKRKS